MKRNHKRILISLIALLGLTGMYGAFHTTNAHADLADMQLQYADNRLKQENYHLQDQNRQYHYDMMQNNRTNDADDDYNTGADNGGSLMDKGNNSDYKEYEKNQEQEKKQEDKTFNDDMIWDQKVPQTMQAQYSTISNNDAINSNYFKNNDDENYNYGIINSISEPYFPNNPNAVIPKDAQIAMGTFWDNTNYLTDADKGFYYYGHGIWKDIAPDSTDVNFDSTDNGYPIPEKTYTYDYSGNDLDDKVNYVQDENTDTYIDNGKKYVKSKLEDINSPFNTHKDVDSFFQKYFPYINSMGLSYYNNSLNNKDNTSNITMDINTSNRIKAKKKRKDLHIYRNHSRIYYVKYRNFSYNKWRYGFPYDSYMNNDANSYSNSNLIGLSKYKKPILRSAYSSKKNAYHYKSNVIVKPWQSFQVKLLKKINHRHSIYRIKFNKKYYYYTNNGDKWDSNISPLTAYYNNAGDFMSLVKPWWHHNIYLYKSHKFYRDDEWAYNYGTNNINYSLINKSRNWQENIDNI